MFDYCVMCLRYEQGVKSPFLLLFIGLTYLLPQKELDQELADQHTQRLWLQLGAVATLETLNKNIRKNKNKRC